MKEKLFILAQKTEVKEKYDLHENDEKEIDKKIKSLERQITLLKAEKEMKKHRLITFLKDHNDYNECFNALESDEIKFEEMLDKLEMMMKINYHDKKAIDILHELIAQIIIDTEDVKLRSNRIEDIIKRKQIIDGDRINNFIYQSIQKKITM